MKSNVNVRPASEAMVCNVAEENADALTVTDTRRLPSSATDAN